MDTGYGAVFDDLDSDERNDSNRVSTAMDVARGGRFLGVPPELPGYPSSSWYSYDAPSCTYGCQKSEYIYWLLTSYLGAQDGPGRAESIAQEWRHNTREKLENGHGPMPPDELGLALLLDPRYRLPIHKLPNGHYAPTVG
jgi:hypothetical protein